ncbi:pilin [Frankia sp. Mgl5]|uniref:pilin n=1 Tax=Frankia sp. Mgl5 TaxID=2933793 RepID=UPI00200D8BCE|nr:pilin [Frankia sp. Mgl5]MCK9931105.1 pilin [Frankia sp. Mgl5]
MTGRGRSLLRHTRRAVYTAGTALRRLLGSVPPVWLGMAGGLAAAGWLLLAQPAGVPTGTGVLVPFGSVGDLVRLSCAALAGSLAILLLRAGGVAVGPSPRRGRRREDLLRLGVGCVVVVVLLVVLSDVAGAAAVVTGQEAPPAPAPVSSAPDLETVLNNARNWLMGILATVATFFFTLGATRYLGANGDPGEVERAKGAFRNAAIGYGLAVLAPLVLKALRSVVGA